jgi:hypothetical protein
MSFWIPKGSLGTVDTVLLALTCSELHRIYICQWDGPRPATAGVTDSTMGGMAKHLGKFYEVQFAFDRSDFVIGSRFLALLGTIITSCQLRLPRVVLLEQKHSVARQ